MVYGGRGRRASRSLFGGSITAAAVIALAAGAHAQSPGTTAGTTLPPNPTSQQPPTPIDTTAETGVPSGVLAIVEANLDQPEKICPACTPLILTDPAAAAELIAAAKKYPDLAEQLAQCLSKIQATLSATNPEGAQTVASLVAGAPPAFQAAYAVALAPGDGGGGGGGGGGAGAGGGGGGAGGGGGGGGGGFGGGFGGGGGGFGGGPLVSPN